MFPQIRRRINDGAWPLLLPLWRVVLIAALIFVFPWSASAAPLAQGTTHKVQSGETLFSIAQRYSVTVDDIVKANNLSSANLIAVGQELQIPGAASVAGDSASTGAADSSSAAVSAPPDSAGPDAASIHVVKSGETLFAIAMKYGVTADELAKTSGISVSDILSVGQKLTIPGQTDSAIALAAPAAPAAPEPAPDVYVVQSGDTLESLAQRFGTSAVSLAQANRLSSPSLVFVGRRLVIPKPKIIALPRGNSHVEVSISRQHCWVYDGDTVVLDWTCSTGRPSSPTKAGSFAIQSKIKKAYASSWNIWMPYWLGVYWAGGTENGFHGLPWNARTGHETWTGLVGTKITYGCVMLTNDTSKILWDMSYIGMSITIEY